MENIPRSERRRSDFASQSRSRSRSQSYSSDTSSSTSSSTSLVSGGDEAGNSGIDLSTATTQKPPHSSISHSSNSIDDDDIYALTTAGLVPAYLAKDFLTFSDLESPSFGSQSKPSSSSPAHQGSRAIDSNQSRSKESSGLLKRNSLFTRGLLLGRNRSKSKGSNTSPSRYSPHYNKITSDHSPNTSRTPRSFRLKSKSRSPAPLKTHADLEALDQSINIRVSLMKQR